MLENSFQARVIEEIENRFPKAIVIKNDSSYIQGFPDLLILFNDTWAALECKSNIRAKQRPNQEWYITLLNKMSFAAFICPENKEEIFNELQLAFRFNRTTRFSRSK